MSVKLTMVALRVLALFFHGHTQMYIELPSLGFLVLTKVPICLMLVLGERARKPQTQQSPEKSHFMCNT